MKNDTKYRFKSSCFSVCAAVFLYLSGSFAIKRYWSGFLRRVGRATLSPYLASLLRMMIFLLLVLFILILTRQVWVLFQRRTSFLKGLVPGSYIILFALMSILYNLFYAGFQAVPNKRLLLYYVIYFLLVGIIEELFFRGILAEQILQIILEHKHDRSSIIKSVIFSSLIFALFHIQNLFGADAAGVLIQMLGAFLIGMVFTAVYYRTGNIYVVIFLHAFNDIAAVFPLLFGQNDAGLSDIISSYGLLDIFLLLAYIPVLLVVLRRAKTDEILQRI